MPESPETQSPDGRVLVVDDERGPRESLRLILAPRYAVDTAGDARLALERIRRSPPDVLLLDLKMPGTSGLELLEQVRKIDRELEVIIVTGYGSYDSAVQALRLGAFDYISKPFDSAVVSETVRRAIEQRQERRRRISVEQLERPVHDLCEQTYRLESHARPVLSRDDRHTLERIGALARRLRRMTNRDDGNAAPVSPKESRE